MAEDNDTTTEGAPAGADAEALDAARALLLANGQHVLGSEEFHGVKQKAAEKAKREASDLAAQLEAERAEKAELARYKAEVENKGKSEMELLQERQRAWEQSDAEKQAAIDAATKERDDLSEQLQRERVENRVRSLLAGATNADAAMLWAREKIGSMLSVNEAGDLVWTDPRGVPHEGQAAANLVTEWWADQKFLQSSKPSGPPTTGAPAAPSQTAPQKPERQPFEELRDYLIRVEKWQAQQQR